MQGCRPLSKIEVRRVRIILEKGRHAARNVALFVLGKETGYRISELLSLKVCDIWQGGRVVDRVTVARRNTKGKRAGRTIPITKEARQALALYIALMEPKEGFLFPSQKSIESPMTREQAYRILKKAYRTAGISGQTGTHSMRKTFAKKVLTNSNNLIVVQKALGHRRIETTTRYLEVNQDDIDRAILGDDE